MSVFFFFFLSPVLYLLWPGCCFVFILSVVHSSSAGAPSNFIVLPRTMTIKDYSILLFYSNCETCKECCIDFNPWYASLLISWGNFKAKPKGYHRLTCKNVIHFFFTRPILLGDLNTSTVFPPQNRVIFFKAMLPEGFFKYFLVI